MYVTYINMHTCTIVYAFAGICAGEKYGGFAHGPLGAYMAQIWHELGCEGAFSCVIDIFPPMSTMIRSLQAPPAGSPSAVGLRHIDICDFFDTLNAGSQCALLHHHRVFLEWVVHQRTLAT